MKFPVTAQAMVKDGSAQLSEWQRDRFTKFLQSREGKQVQITMRDCGKPRSINQKREIEDQFPLFLAAKQIWQKECSSVSMFKKDYPTSISLF